MSNKLTVLSLFDGMSGTQLALRKLGLEPDQYTYYASEVDKHAITVTQANFPGTVQLGDVTQWRTWTIPQPDIIVAGSPCQGFSMAGKQNNFNDPRSALFFQFLHILHHYKPRYFLLENVVMKQEYVDTISTLLDTDPILINSALVSAQNRKRLYWTNIPDITQPDDLGIKLADIIEDTPQPDSAYRSCKAFGEIPTEALCHHMGTAMDINGHDCLKRVYAGSGKSPTLNACTGGNREPKAGFYGAIKNRGKLDIRSDKSMCVVANYWKGVDNHGMRTVLAKPIYSATMVGRRINPETNCRDDYNMDIPSRQYIEISEDPSKSRCLSTVQKDTLLANKTEGRHLIEDVVYRKLTPLECERLQTVPDNYTNHVSATQRYKMLGNGFTVDVIAHILKGAIK